MWCHLLKEDECSKRSRIALAAKKYIMPGGAFFQKRISKFNLHTLLWKKNGDLKNDND